MSTLLVKGFLTLMLGLTVTHVSAASFNCEAARSKIEMMICADRGLSKLDEKLSAAYTHIRQPPREEKPEKAMQVAWLHTRNTCTDSNCLQGEAGVWQSVHEGVLRRLRERGQITWDRASVEAASDL